MKIKKDVCEESTFDSIYKANVTALRNFIFFKSGNEPLSHDIIQESFIKLWQNCAKVPPNKAKAFLYKVSNHIFLNQVAHQKVVFKYAKLKPNLWEKHHPHFLLEEKEFGERLEKAISNLTELQRTAFLLSRIEGKKYREIAELLNISEKAVSKRIHDALENLRKNIENI